jgi:hypothetical protein
MLRNFSLDEPIRQDENLVIPVQRAAPSSRSLAAALRTVASALRDGLLAARQYEHLRSSGVAHDLALRMAIGVGHASSDIRPTARRPLAGPLARRPHSGEAAARRATSARSAARCAAKSCTGRHCLSKSTSRPAHAL